MIRSDEARSDFELSLLGQGVPAGRTQGEDLRATRERRSTGETGADRGGGDRPEDSSRADMGSDHGDQVRADMDGDQAVRRLTSRQRAIVAACDVPRSLAELMERAGVSHRSHFRRKHLKPLLDAGLVRMTNPANPRAPNQKYALTDARAALKERWARG